MKRCGHFQPIVPFNFFNDPRFFSELKNLTFSFLRPVDTQSAVSVSQEWKQLTIKTQKDILIEFGKSLGIEVENTNNLDTLIKIKSVVKNNFIHSLSQLNDDDFEKINIRVLPPLFFDNFFYIARLHQKMKYLDLFNPESRKICMKLMKNGYIHPVINHINKNTINKNLELYTFSNNLTNEKHYECATILANLIENKFLKNLSLAEIHLHQTSDGGTNEKKL